MEVVLYFAAVDGAGEVRLIKRLKKPPAVLPTIGDLWLQADWLLVVQDREWTENMDRVTLYLGQPGNAARRHVRYIVGALLDAGWTDEPSPRDG